MHRDKRGYWYRSKRIGKQVVKEYLGAGSYASLLARSEEILQPQEAAARREELAMLQAIEAVDAPIEAACDAIQAVMCEQLQQAGYHQHKRGEWRKRR